MLYMYVILSIKLLDIMLRPKGIQALVEGLKSKCFYMWKTKKKIIFENILTPSITLAIEMNKNY